MIKHLIGLSIFALLLALVPFSVQSQDKKLIIGYTARDLNNFPLFAAQAKGFFKEAGKDVELVQIRSNIGLSGLLGGSVDYYTSFSSAVTLAAQQGAPILGIFSMIERPSLYMVARPEIRTMADLRGKTVGLGSIGGITVTITRRMLAYHGVGANDFNIVSSGDLPVRLAAVKSGAIHATLAGPPAPVQAKEMGLNPRSLLKNIPNKSQPWKMPVADWIRELYRKRRPKAGARRGAEERDGLAPAEGSRRPAPETAEEN